MENKNKILNVIFYTIFIIFTFSILFYLFGSFRTKYTAFIELSAISAIVILPTVLPKIRLWIKIALNIFLFLILSHYTVINQPGLELAAPIYVLFLFSVLLLVVIISHFIFKWVWTSQNVKIKSAVIAAMTLVIIIFVILSAYNIYSQYVQYKNNNVFNDILCKGAYTTTSPEEFEALCERIIEKSVRYWSLVRSHCFEVANKIKTDKYYFDYDFYKKYNYDPLRWPGNYKKCANQKRSFLEGKYISPNYSSIILPEVEDPLLCEYADGEYAIQNLGPATQSSYGQDDKSKCYNRVALATKNSAYCWKMIYNSSFCYQGLSKLTNDKKLCDNISDNNFKNLCYGQATLDDSFCTEINTSLQINCYSYIAKHKNDISICEKADSDLFISECKDWYRTKTF
ncbi:MAG: hypothetical protein CEN87_639 [Parcubacteria group bacterium Licking1014_1]|nr:MAG: hypothetical protein CEN87_639 [Parcubacteria group bacterium Licking1014_1]